MTTWILEVGLGAVGTEATTIHKLSPDHGPEVG